MVPCALLALLAQADTMSDLYKRIKAVDYKFPEWVSPEFKDLIGKVRNERLPRR